jgi:hypothetical protein
MDNGPELTSHALRDWCRFNRAGTVFVRASDFLCKRCGGLYQ